MACRVEQAQQRPRKMLGQRDLLESTDGRVSPLLKLARTPLASLSVLLYCVALALMAGRAAAHHSAAMYDDKKTITVVGTVRKFEWSNPHVYI